MKTTAITLQLIAMSVLTTAAWAQTPAEQDQQRDVNQQQRIEQGLQSGQLSTKEAGSLEHQEKHVDNMEARDPALGEPPEPARLSQEAQRRNEVRLGSALAQ